MKTLKFTLSFSFMLLVASVMTFAQKHVYAQESTGDGLNESKRVTQQLVTAINQNKVKRSTPVVPQVFTKDEIVRNAEQIIRTEQGLIVYAKYMFDKDDVLVRRTKFTYDDRNNLTAYREEELNDYSRYWMQWTNKWITVYQYNQDFDHSNNIIRYKEWRLDYDNGELRLINEYSSAFDDMNREVYHEAYYWDANYHMMKGSQKYEQHFDSEGRIIHYESYLWNDNQMNWVGDYKEITEIDALDCITNKEQYVWNYEMNTWAGQSKFTSTYQVDGDNIYEEQFFWLWDNNANTWFKDTSYKRQYTYQIINQRYWYELRYAFYELRDSDYVLVDEITRVPYPQGNSYLSSLRRKNVEGVMTDYSKSEYQYNENNKWTQVTTSVWMTNEWKESELRLYTYSTPDSVRTQTNMRTVYYYQFYGLTTPNLCQGQTLYPVSKIFTKSHQLTGKEEVYYAYRWEYGICNWVPNSSKRLIVFDVSGEKTLSYTECNEYDQSDWINCYNRQTVYNESGKMIEDAEYIGGEQIRKVVNVFDEQGFRVEKYVYRGDTLDYKYELKYNEKGRVIKQILNRINPQLPLGKSRYKWEIEYFADTIMSVVNGYVGADINADGILQDEEWAYDGKEIYKYDTPITGDSVHIQTNTYGDIVMLDFGPVKKIKITGPVTNDDLAYLNEACRDSLQLLDLESALVEDNTLKGGVFEETTIRTIVLSSTLQKIEKEAIVDYDGYLQELIIFPSLQEFEPGAVGAMGIKRLEIKSEFFDRMYSFIDEEMNIPGVVNIYKSKLEKITFNDTHGKLPNEICYNLAYLKEVVIKDGITEIGDNAFKSCGLLRTVILPATLTKIGYNAFWGCNELTELIIPEGTTDVGYSAFWGCSGVTAIQMPSTLQSIGKNAFWGCTSVEKMEVRAIEPPVLGDYALAGVPRDAALTIPAISVELYKSKPQWTEFYRINTGVDENILENVRVIVSGRKLSLYNLPVETNLQVYTVSGLKIIDIRSANEVVMIELEPGVYIVKVGNDLRKIVVR